ncbi:hypothetical protein [Halopseudomonas sp.]|uniref:hypothetical protein n=1 Tax=Halopseudomonas sp. TaxID=2901191 RepID=UPI003564D48E
MPLFHAAWLYYLSNPALVINGLALFYAVAGSWLVFAGQWRSGRGTAQLTAGVSTGLDDDSAALNNRVSRMFGRIGLGCLALAMLLSLLSTLA